MEPIIPERVKPWRSIVIGLAIAAGLVFAFGHNFVEMWARWFPAWHFADLGLYQRLVEGESYYTHGPLVPLVSLLIAWLLIRHTRIPVRPRPILGGLVVAGSLAVHLMACLARVNFVSGFAFVAVLSGLVLMLWGLAALRRLWFPLAFLLFMVPLPDVTINNLNFELKMIAARLGVTLADAVGILAERDGNRVVLMGDKSLVIANVCNGLRTLISLLAFGALYAYVCRLRGLWRIGLFLMSIPVTVVSNSIRIVALIAVADVWDVKTATGWFHDTSGMLIYVLAFLLMFAIEKGMLWLRKLMGKTSEAPILFADQRRTEQDAQQGAALAGALGSRSAVVAMLAVALSAAGAYALNASTPTIWAKNVAENALPGEMLVQNVHLAGHRQTMDRTTLGILETEDYFYSTYAGVGAAPTDFCVIFSRDNRKGTHPPDLCLQGSGEGITVRGEVVVSSVPGRGEVSCRELVVETGTRRVYFLYTYKCGDRYTSSFWAQQFLILLGGLTHRDASGALIRVSVPIVRDVPSARQWCTAFMQEAIPHLDKNLQLGQESGS